MTTARAVGLIFLLLCALGAQGYNNVKQPQCRWTPSARTTTSTLHALSSDSEPMSPSQTTRQSFLRVLPIAAGIVGAVSGAKVASAALQWLSEPTDEFKAEQAKVKSPQSLPRAP